MSSFQEAVQENFEVQQRHVYQFLGGSAHDHQIRRRLELKLFRDDAACEQAMQHDLFQAWSSGTGPAHRELAMIGGMGCGKSTNMSFIVQTLESETNGNGETRRVCYHFCVSDGSDTPKSVISSLLFRYVRRSIDSHYAFYEWYLRARQRFGDEDQACRMLLDWLKKELQRRVETTIFVVDGIDQCTTENRRRLLTMLTELCDAASSTKVLVSTRPEKEIIDDLDDFSMMWLRWMPDGDQKIVQKHVDMKLHSFDEWSRTLWTACLLSRGMGSALWISEMATAIFYGAARCTTDEITHVVLEEMVPPSLREIYNGTYERYIQKGNGKADELVVQAALAFLAVSPRPLSIAELIQLAQAGASRQQNLDVAEVVAPTSLSDCESLLSQISPFVSIDDWSQMHKEQIKVAHASVKQHILHEGVPNGPVFAMPGRLHLTADQRQAIKDHAANITTDLHLVAGILGIQMPKE